MWIEDCRFWIENCRFRIEDLNDEQSEGNKILLRIFKQLLQVDRFDPNVGTSFTPQGIFTAYERHKYKIIELLSISKRTDLNVRDLMIFF